MNPELNKLVFGREEITREERSFLKHNLVGAIMFWPGGIYGSKVAPGQHNPFQAALESYYGKGDELFKAYKERQSMSPPTNEDRIKNAAEIVENYAGASGLSQDPVETQVSDLVTELRHYCAYKGVSFEEVLRRSEDHFTTEVTGEPS